MTKKPTTSKDTADKVVKNIRRKTRQTYSEVVLVFRPVCSLIKMDQGFI